MYKYTLEKKSKKHICPDCGKKRFVKYIETNTDEYLASHVGRCDRELNCGYHYPPKSYFEDNNQQYIPFIHKKMSSKDLKIKMSFHSVEDLTSTLTNYSKNNFVQFLNTKFKSSEVKKLLKDYKIGTATNWHNATIFWQMDEENRIRGGKIISYTSKGKRTQYINWVHAIQLKRNQIPEFNLNQCLFGLNLINKYQKSIAIVESEKTACIMSLIFDKYLWLATGSLNGLNEKKLKVIKNRKIVLYPDLGKTGKNGSPFSQWKLKCDNLKKKNYDIHISELLENNATNEHREKGYDIADYFLENQKNGHRKIISKKQQDLIQLYQKNKNIKTLIDVFCLYDDNGNKFNL